MRDALDASFSLPVPALVAAQGFDMLVYTGNARPDQGWVDDCRSRGVAVTFIQQTVNERAQEGYNAGVVDAQYADRRATERGHPYDATMVYVVSDGSRDNPTWNGDAIADYGQAVAQQSARPFMFYGNRYAVDHATAGARRVARNAYGNAPRLVAGPRRDGGWVPATWNYDANRDPLRQNIGYYTAAGGTCDHNTTHHDYLVAQPGGFLMALTDDEQAELLQAARLVTRGVPEFGQRGVFDNARALAQTGVPEYGLPNLFQGQHDLKALLLAGGAIDPGDGLTDDDRARLLDIRDRINEMLLVNPEGP